MADAYSVQVLDGFSVVQHIGNYRTLEEAEKAAEAAASFAKLGANEAVVISEGGNILRDVKSGKDWPR